ncbi:3-aminobutyryl-CoA ammonia lyase [bioreactor metagenome]|uniref:3-aminobutyryl-CoA ammonia lyase n=1 Tax=bioreactor metagenome TaxID=1076179 RepID=A0A645FPU2_9ZZZZ
MFAGYKDIEFLVPVYGGDYIEYHGWIEKVGNTSRTCKFEAYKVARLLRDPNLNLFSAEALDPPVLIGRATGTLVVKKEWQRGATDTKFAHK